MPSKFPNIATRSIFPYETIPTFMALFHLFWTPNFLQCILVETNRYARMTVGAEGRTHGGLHWKDVIMAALQAFIALALYMGLKRQPNYKTYWSCDTLFHYPMVGNIFTQARFMAIRRCLHVTNCNLYIHIELGASGMTNCSKRNGL